jgi:hypothetical protein
MGGRVSMGNIGPSFLCGLVLTLFLAGVIVENLPRGKKMSPLRYPERNFVGPAQKPAYFRRNSQSC